MSRSLIFDTLCDPGGFLVGKRKQINGALWDEGILETRARAIKGVLARQIQQAMLNDSHLKNGDGQTDGHQPGSSVPAT